jgi:hypothetical protein
MAGRRQPIIALVACEMTAAIQMPLMEPQNCIAFGRPDALEMASERGQVEPANDIGKAEPVIGGAIRDMDQMEGLSTTVSGLAG